MNLKQKYPSHPGKGYSLDLLFCPVEIVTKAEFCDPLVPTDERNYRAATFHLDPKVDKSIIQDTILLDYVKGDYAAINSNLKAINWDSMNLDDDINTVTNEFYGKVNSAISDHIPSRRVFNSSFPTWYSPELKETIFKKKMAHVRFKESNMLNDYIQFKQLRALCIKHSRSCYRLYIEHIESSLHSNLKYFWSYIKKSAKSMSIPSQVSYKDRLSGNDEEASDLFASFFGSVYRNPYSGPVNLSNDNPTCLSLFQTSYEELVKVIRAAKDNPNYGPDLIPMYFIKH